MSFVQLLHREGRLLARRPAALANPLVFFAVVATLFPLAIGADPALLRKMAPGLVWVAAVLAVLLSLDSLFREDFEDGSLEQWALGHHGMIVPVLAKITAYWLLTGLALCVLAPVLGLMLGLPARTVPTLMATLALGTPVLTLLGAIGAALTVGVRRGGLLLALLVLPLYIPVLILGSGALRAALDGLPVDGFLLWLASLAVLALTLGPWAVVAGLRISLNE
ncbi:MULTISPECIES: heme exporter protein CcmB [Pseudomonas]|uniref:Heme exporter protein B n=1 Tax=Pseudomonas quercus TaxID=2722792 RepID=A0ABX0YDL4_9PSED|nr:MULTISPECIES: heme exporter protein CcmB [Pseudomonas]MBF7142454.1 heme exporter protein CcmB [Pseudomonas sp. LY10J]NJP00992.1 heme exporter protein CcmB [Pseudomonas quercus]